MKKSLFLALALFLCAPAFGLGVTVTKGTLVVKTYPTIPQSNGMNVIELRLTSDATGEVEAIISSGFDQQLKGNVTRTTFISGTAIGTATPTNSWDIVVKELTDRGPGMNILNGTGANVSSPATGEPASTTVVFPLPVAFLANRLSVEATDMGNAKQATVFVFYFGAK